MEGVVFGGRDVAGEGVKVELGGRQDLLQVRVEVVDPRSGVLQVIDPRAETSADKRDARCRILEENPVQPIVQAGWLAVGAFQCCIGQLRGRTDGGHTADGDVYGGEGLAFGGPGGLYRAMERARPTAQAARSGGRDGIGSRPTRKARSGKAIERARGAGRQSERAGSGARHRGVGLARGGGGGGRWTSSSTEIWWLHWPTLGHFRLASALAISG
jgi:hypothetical protein